MRPLLFYTLGYPGAGKTTFAKGLGQWLGATYISGDRIGFELFRFPTYSTQERQMVYQEMQHRTIESLRRGDSVIYDAANNTTAQRAALIKLAENEGCRAIGIWLEVPLTVAKKRAGKLRDKDIVGTVARIIPPHIFDQYIAAFEPPVPTEYIIKIAGNTRFFLQYRSLRERLKLPRKQLPPIV